MIQYAMPSIKALFFKGLTEGLNFNAETREYKPRENLLATIFTFNIIFDITQLGACAHRSSFAAIEMKFALKERYKIMLCYNKPYDQWYIKIQASSDQQSVFYDPLLNPELVFTEQQYQKEIVLQYPISWHELDNPPETEITSEIVKNYHRLKAKFGTEIIKIIQDLISSEQKWKMAQMQLNYIGNDVFVWRVASPILKERVANYYEKNLKLEKNIISMILNSTFFCSADGKEDSKSKDFSTRKLEL